MSIDGLAEAISANAIKADAVELELAAFYLLIPTDAKGPGEVAARILEEFDRRSVGHYRYQGTLIFELAGDLFVIHD